MFVVLRLTTTYQVGVVVSPHPSANFSLAVVVPPQAGDTDHLERCPSPTPLLLFRKHEDEARNEILIPSLVMFAIRHCAV